MIFLRTLLAAFAAFITLAQAAPIGPRTALVTRLTREVLPPVVQTWTHDFASVCLPAGFTFTRSGNAWEWNAGGTLVTYAANVPMCPGYAARGATNFGIGISSARTNYFRNSLTPATQSPAMAAAGAYITSVVGSGSVELSGSGISCTATAAVPCTFQTSTASQVVTHTVTGSPNCVQTELVFAGVVSGTPTPCIPTTASTAARSADVLWGPLSSLGLSDRRGSFLVEFMVPTLLSNINRTIVMVAGNESANNGYRLFIRAADGRLAVSCENAGVLDTGAVTPNAIVPGAVNRAIVTYDRTRGVTVALNGSAFATRAAAGCAYNLQRLYVGSNRTGTFQLQGYIKSLRAFSGRLQDASAQALAAPPNPALSQSMKLNWAMGQSNCAGAWAGPIITASPPYPSQVLMFDDRWGVAGPRYNYYWISFTNSGVSGLVPAFEAFAPLSPWIAPHNESLSESGLVAAGAERVFEGSSDILVMRGACAAGQPISGLMPGGGGSFPSVIDSTAALKNLAALNGGTVTVDSIHFVHGESDRLGGLPRAAYTAQALSLGTSVISGIKTATGQTNDPIIYLLQLQASGVANGDGSEIQLAQYDFTLGEQSNTVWRMCAPRYMFPTTTRDGLHHPASANIWAGEYVGHCRRREEVSGQPWKPTYPLTIGFDATDKALIHTTWHTPVSPLAFDGAAPIQGPAYMHGLQYLDDCVAASLAANQQPYAYVTGASLTGAAAMDVTLSAPRNPACGTPRLQHAYNGPIVAAQTQMPTIAAGGSGGTDGACVITTSFDPSGPGVAQATYNATISGGALVSIESNVYPGLWPAWDQGTKNSVAVTGCGLAGAQVSNLILRRGLNSLAMTGAWSDIRDSDPQVSRSGNALRNWAVVFDLPITP